MTEVVGTHTILTTRSSPTSRGFALVICAATLGVPRHVVEFLARLLAAHRQLRTSRGSRALGPFRRAVLVLR
ncbi:hypothetical protein ACIGW5_27880 [Streptomyces prasinus]|uniref:hypothetical protein n=1 Tax=Streptomyces prasinus TaxID=67345 RepID=UPI0037CF2BEB